MKGLSLFAGGGIGEMGFKNSPIDIVLANELLPIRAKLHEYWHPNTKMIVGDISDKVVKNEIIKNAISENVKFVICTPPCQGVSLIGKNKNMEDYVLDERNYLLFDALEIIKELDADVILIENVPRYLNLSLPYKGKLTNIIDIIKSYFGKNYIVDSKVYNAQNFGIAQSRERAFIKIHRKGSQWNEAIVNEETITLREAIGDLPPLESGEISNLKNHNARKHSKNHIKWMSNTPTGQSALDNPIHFPKNNKTGEKVKAYSSTYKRLDWDTPSPTITMRNDAISSQSNVHPGRLKPDGTYSDARVLSLRELFILTGIEPDIDVPDFISDSQVRHVIGEAVPPVMIERIIQGIFEDESN